MINGVHIKKLKQIPDERGRLFEILRRDDPQFQQFGQAYITTTYPNVIKAWHLHKIQTDNVCCINGMIRLALYDDRENSPTFQQIEEHFIGNHNLMLITIPPGVWHGWRALGDNEAIILNLPTVPYNHDQPDEYRLHPFNNDIPLDWDFKGF